MSRMSLAAVAVVIALICVPPSSRAQGRGHGRGQAHAQKGNTADQDVAIDREGHVRAIREYARDLPNARRSRPAYASNSANAASCPRGSRNG